MTHNNTRLEQMLIEAYSSLDQRTSRVFRNRYKVDLPVRPTCRFNQLGHSAFYQIFIFLGPVEYGKCHVVCKLWN
jgi:hypothetical protein